MSKYDHLAEDGGPDPCLCAVPGIAMKPVLLAK